MSVCVVQSSDEGSSDVASNISSSDAAAVNTMSQSHHHNDGHNDAADVAQFYVAKLDFDYVDTPLLVVVWVLFTAAAKIGHKYR